MTLEQIANLTVEDCQETLEYRLIEKDSEVIVSPELLLSELDLYKAELTQIEQARLDEVARIDDLKDRYHSLKDHNRAMAALGISNGLLHFNKDILGNADKVQAEALMVTLESTDATKDSEYQLVKYKDQRAKEYPPIQEQLDMLFHDKQNNTSTWVDAIQAIKTKYPKA